MSSTPHYGLEQARIKLPSLATKANAGVASIITRHGKPYAAIVSIEDLEKSATLSHSASSLLALRGTGRGLWGASTTQTIAEMRDEWEDA